MTYTLGGALGEKAVRPGTNLLVTGPPVTGKRRLAREVLQRGMDDGQGAIVITMRDPAERVQRLFDDASNGNDENRIGIVDAVTEHVGRSQTEAEMIRYASSPSDMTEMGIKFAEFIEYFHCERGTPRNRVMVDSITTLLQYSPLQTVFRFLHAVTTRVVEVEAVGVFVVESTVHDGETMNTICELFDGVVETDPDGTLTVDVPGVDDFPGARTS